MLPKISIITPSFNQGLFLEDTIVSVLDQQYPNLEYIIVDGGSTDNSVSIIKKYESKINYWVSEKDSGQSEAINKGFSRATGEILSWLCSDDLYLPGTLNKVAQLFTANPDTVMIHGRSILFDESGKETIKGADKEELDLRYFTVIPFPQPSSFFRKKLISEQGLLREDLHFAMDYDLLIRTALWYKILPAEDIFSRYRLHKDSKTTSQIKSFAKEWIKVFSKFIRSVKNSDLYIGLLSGSNLYVKGDDVYQHNREFNEDELKLIVLYFLDFMAHLHYHFVERSRTIEITALIKSIDESFYERRSLGSIAFRAKYFPSGMIRILRSYLNK
jgi:glycosyltransferase involved in cell wall biosynthesis